MNPSAFDQRLNNGQEVQAFFSPPSARAAHFAAADVLEGEPAGPLFYWRILKRRKFTLLLISVLGVLSGLAVTLPQKPVYRAHVALEIQNPNADFLNTKQVNPVSEDSASMNVLTDVQTQMRIIRSDSLVDRVIDKLKAAGKLPATAEQDSHFSFFPFSHSGPRSSSAAQLDYELRVRALRNLSVRQSGQTRVVEVFYESTDSRYAAEFVNALAAEYIESNMEARWKMSERTGIWLSRQLAEMRTKLEQSESALQAYARRSGLLFTPSRNGTSETNVADEKLLQIQEALSRAQADRAVAQSHFEIAQTAPADTVADVLNDEPLRDLQAKLTDLHRQEAELITIYTPKNEKVRRIQAQIAPVRASFNSERSAIIDRINNDYHAALRREKLLQQDYETQSKIVTTQAEKAVQYNILKHESDSDRQLYESMLGQLKEAGVVSAIRASNVRLLETAKVPRERYGPSYKLSAILGLFGGLLLGVTVVVLLENADSTFREPGDLPFWINLPELGVIPNANLDVHRKSRPAFLGSPRPPEPPSNGRMLLASVPRGKDPVVISWRGTSSIIAEAFRTVLTSIMFAGENGNHPRVIALTSAQPREGKTTVVTNLGIAMAEIRQNILIIDADMRSPRLHELFDLPNDRGLSTFLENKSLAANSLDGLIQETALPGLFVLPSGPPTHNSANLLHSPTFEQLIGILKQKFDIVLLDTPPMLHMTDARVVGRLADAVILVVRADKTTRDAARACQQRLFDDRIRTLGGVLNGWDAQKSSATAYSYEYTYK